MSHASIINRERIVATHLQQPVALYGYTETAKHLLIELKNKDISVVCIIDNSPDKQQWQLGGVPVLRIEDINADEIGSVIICSETYKYNMIESCLEKGLTDCMYTECGVDVFEHESFFRTVYRKAQVKPTTCMPQQAQSMLLQFMDLALDSVEGEILELGTAAGGATYLMATLMSERQDIRPFTSVDLFQPTPYIIPCFEEVVSALRCFSFVSIIQDEFNSFLQKKDANKKYAFCLYDANIKEDILLDVYERLNDRGILFLDNYGQAKQELSKVEADKALRKLQKKPIILSTGQAVVFKS